MKFPFFLLIGPFSFTLAFGGEIALSPLFTDEAVLQRDVPVTIWGTGSGDITVKIGDATAGAEITANGWRAVLPARAAGGPVDIEVRSGSTVVATARGVLFGDVWLCSGQSNMLLKMGSLPEFAKLAETANDPELRCFDVPIRPSELPEDSLAGGRWNPLNGRTLGGFSAIAYYFGATLREDLNIPIGLLQSSQGGTGAQSWMPVEALRGTPDLEALFTKYESNLRSNAKLYTDRGGVQRAAVLYNGMIHPLVGLPIKGVLWYQGETNVLGPVYSRDSYALLLTRLIESWRAAWGRPDLPFILAQLPRFAFQKKSTGTEWAELRAAQAEVARTDPRTSITSLIDLGERDEIHPKDKAPAGRRLADTALAAVYAQPVPPPPTPGVSRWSDTEVQIDFSEVITGDAPDLDFRLENGSNVVASGRIEGERTLVVPIPPGLRPVALRYAWRNFPESLLRGGNGNPVAPFESRPDSPR